nr:tyrosine-type recombinase/integrase [uncultured Vibrio sp.]
MNNLPEGVEIRGKSIRISFTYKRKRCKETLKGWPATKQNIKKAGQLRSRIVSQISDGSFCYASQFPNSKSPLVLSSPKQQQLTLTVRELFDLWLSTKEAEVTKNTLRKITSELKTCAELLGEDRLANNITLADALTVRSKMLASSTRYTDRPNRTGMTATSVNNYLSTCKNVFEFSREARITETNPFDSVKRLRREQHEPDPLEVDEYNRIMTNATLSQQDKNIITLAVFTGMRHGELCALAWEDIDLVKRQIKVSRNLSRLDHFKLPKTKSGVRTINLLQPAFDALQSQRAISQLCPSQDVDVKLLERGRARTDSCTWVFINSTSKDTSFLNKLHLSNEGIRQAWDRCVKRAGIRRRNPYQTRHTYACWMLTKGANVNFVAQQMGHRNAQMVMNVYGKFMPSAGQSEVDRLNDQFSNCPTSVPSANTS